MLIRAFFILFIIFSSGLTFAETIPATSSVSKKWNVSGTLYATWPDAGVAVCATHNGGWVAYSGGVNGSCNNVWMVNPDPNSQTNCKGVCTDNYYQFLNSTTTTTYSCPTGQNWTLSGTSCTRPDCVSPQTRQTDGTCSSGCSAKAGQQASLGFFETSANTYPPSSACYSGCLAAFTSSKNYTQIVAGVQKYYTSGYYTFLGAPGFDCVNAGKPAGVAALGSIPSASCAAGQSGGTVTVGGVSSYRCYDTSGNQVAAQSSPSLTTSSSTSATVNGDGTTTETTTSTKPDGTATTTIKIYNTSTGQPVSSSTTAPEAGPQKVQDDASDADRSAAHQAKNDGDAAIANTGVAGQNTVAGLGLPTSNPYSAFDTSGFTAVLPSNSGGACVTLDANLPYFGTVRFDPCPIVAVVSPMIDKMLIALAVIAALMAVLRPQS
jgi:hypothetical protein